MICNSNPCADRFSKGTWAKNLPDLSSRSVWLGLFLAVLWAAFLEIALVARSPIIARDGILFVKLAQSLDFDTSLVLKADQQPGYPILIWAIHRISSARASGNGLESWISVARWIAGVSGILLVPVSWFLTWKLFNPPAALATAFLVASLPLFRQNAADALSDAPHLLLYLLSVWLLVEGFQRWKWAYFLASGLLSIMAFSLRPEGLGPVVAGGAILLLCGLKTGRLTVAVRIKCLLALLFGILLALAPFVFYAGKFSTKKRFDNILAQNTCREEALMHPLQFLYRGSSEFLGEGSHAFYYVLLIPLAFGLLSALRHRIDAWVGRFAAALIIIHVSLLVILYANW